LATLSASKKPQFCGSGVAKASVRLKTVKYVFPAAVAKPKLAAEDATTVRSAAVLL
jgi:hypothetical protein